MSCDSIYDMKLKYVTEGILAINDTESFGKTSSNETLIIGNNFVERSKEVDSADRV